MKYVEEQAKRAMVIYAPAWILTLAVPTSGDAGATVSAAAGLGRHHA